jgi:hypothetical protein
MKTTLDIPDLVLRRAKAEAAQHGIPLRQFVTEAVEEKLSAGSKAKENLGCAWWVGYATCERRRPGSID